MDIKKIKAIIELVKESGIAELEISEGEDKLRISTTNHTVAVNTQQQQHIIHTPTSHTQQQLTTQNTITNVPTSTENVDSSKANYITSPMVGTFYRSASPTSQPFIEVGQEVKPGQILCIIEAMKLMNQIESDKAGIIKEILVKDGMPIEYGQNLFVIA
ncbi:MAG: acetyl-CoA carboxylase biotin carboxyl carrier protein [Proteobacteria bacterium]|jgi:acetyl-CoA carboxylase biotin carboxyl carrier protein|nr:acetyl-CoA carboxylase biotin carboxyl carrier protein [Pseudomonadota bacterium]